MFFLPKGTRKGSINKLGIDENILHLQTAENKEGVGGIILRSHPFLNVMSERIYFVFHINKLVSQLHLVCWSVDQYILRTIEVPKLIMFMVKQLQIRNYNWPIGPDALADKLVTLGQLLIEI